MDQCSYSVQSIPAPEVWLAVSDHRDTSSSGSGTEGMADTGHDDTPVGTDELYSLTS